AFGSVFISLLSLGVAYSSYRVTHESAVISQEAAHAYLAVTSARRSPQPDAFTSEWSVTLENPGGSLATDVKFGAIAVTLGNPPGTRIRSLADYVHLVSLPAMVHGQALKLPVQAFSYVPEEHEPQTYGVTVVLFSWRDSSTGKIEGRMR